MGKLFLTDDEIEMERKYQERLKKRVKLPTDIEGSSDKMKTIVCYNRNIVGAGCTTMNGIESPGENCRLYCPFVIERLGKPK